MREIPLGKSGKVALVDDADYEWLNKWRWRIGGRYVIADGRDGKPNVTLSRLILNAPAGMEVDHINGDRLDNRRANLRCSTRSQNQSNIGTCSRNKSGFKGVFFHKPLGKWTASIMKDRQRYYIGNFTDPIDAARAYDKKAVELFGEFARVNFRD